MSTIVFWGRTGNYGPDYPRNRTLVKLLRRDGHHVEFFQPRVSALAGVEYALTHMAPPDVIWVPCFRQRDVAAAARYAKKRNIPLIFDPLISAYDKQVEERKKFSPHSRRAKRLQHWEMRLFQSADWVVADTQGHADFFHDVLSCPREKLVVIPVGAEEGLFDARPMSDTTEAEPLELVFFGSFIGLQGVDVLARAICVYDGAPVHWRLIGDGPLRKACQDHIALYGVNPGNQVTFESWMPLQELPESLATADAILGIFGTSSKAMRVIPNKVYQGLALGRPVITAATPAYPEQLTTREDAGIFWVRPGDPDDLVQAVKRLSLRRGQLHELGAQARHTYDTTFSNNMLASELSGLLQRIGIEALAKGSSV